MAPKRPVSFEHYKKGEEARQTVAGFPVPNAVSQPHAAAVWTAEASRRFLAFPSGQEVEQSTAASTATIASAAVSADEITAAARAIASWSGGGSEAQIVTKFAARDEIVCWMQQLECLLALHFYEPDNQCISKTLRKMKTEVEHYRSSGHLAHEAGKYPSINFLFEIFCFRRLVVNWGLLSPQNRDDALKTALMLFRQFDSPEHLEAGNIVASAIADGLSDRLQQRLVAAIDAACQMTHLVFRKNVAVVRAAQGSAAKDPSSTIIYDNPPTPQQTDGSRKHLRAADDDIEDADTTDDEPTLVKDILSSARNPKKVLKVDLVAGAGSAAHTPHAAPAKTAAVKRVPQPRTASSHPYPCRSKYHSKYSSIEKHASPECSFCCVCHMMEFLFNGCTRDCTWQHKPTPKKIAIHLKAFSNVFQLARKQLDNLAVGDVVEKVEIPL
jgi:hypothetical protein